MDRVHLLEYTSLNIQVNEILDSINYGKPLVVRNKQRFRNNRAGLLQKKLNKLSHQLINKEIELWRAYYSLDKLQIDIEAIKYVIP